MADACLLFMAYRDGRPIGGALNLVGDDALYGRYWGAIEEVPFLHFELSYYRAIEWAIDHGLASVQAGAQGEHKLARGYEPVITRSAHFLPDPGFRRAVADFLVARGRNDRRGTGMVPRGVCPTARRFVDRDPPLIGPGEPAIHAAGGEAPGRLARRGDGDQAARAAEFA